MKHVYRLQDLIQMVMIQILIQFTNFMVIIGMENPNIYNSNIINTSTKCIMEELYKNTQKKKQTCIELGYNYVEILESQWNRFKRIISMVQLNFRKRKSNSKKRYQR